MRVLSLLAVLLAPLTMMEAHVAAAPMAATHAMDGPSTMPGHCAPSGEERDKQKPAPNIDCTIMCSAMPATDCLVPTQLIVPDPDPVRPFEPGGNGLNPAADPPPPRLS